jgi:hypothetical protein
VPSRTRFQREHLLEVGALLVDDELSIDSVGDPALEAPHCLHGLLALGSFASVVGPTFAVDTDLADRGDVDHVVHPPVPGPRQPVPVLFRRRSLACVRRVVALECQRSRSLWPCLS